MISLTPTFLGKTSLKVFTATLTTTNFHQIVLNAHARKFFPSQSTTLCVVCNVRCKSVLNTHYTCVYTTYLKPRVADIVCVQYLSIWARYLSTYVLAESPPCGSKYRDFSVPSSSTSRSLPDVKWGWNQGAYTPRNIHSWCVNSVYCTGRRF